jgi:hypothetical protein
VSLPGATVHAPPLAQRGPGELQRFLQDARQELEALDGHLQTAHNTLGDAEERWTAHLDSIMDELDEEYAGKRMPGEDQRISIARRRGGATAWTNYRRAKRAAERLEQRVGLLKAQISAAQSEGKLGV